MIEFYTTTVEKADALIDLARPLGRPLSRHQGSGARVSTLVSSALLLLFFFCLVTLVAAPAFAQTGIDNAKEALTKKAYPWYDAEVDGTRSIELGERPEARSANRAEIPLKKTKLKKNSNTPLNTGGGGGGGGNFGGAFVEGLGALTWALIIALMLVVVGVLVWAMLRMSTEPGGEDDDAVSQRTMAESIKQLPFELDVPTGDFRQQSQAAYAAGDYRRAMTYLFSHVLVTLDQKGLIRLRKGKTNRQYLSELRSIRPLADYYQHVMVPFEASFFGDHELSKGDFESCWEGLDTFQSDVQTASQKTVTSQNSPGVRVANA